MADDYTLLEPKIVFRGEFGKLETDLTALRAVIRRFQKKNQINLQAKFDKGKLYRSLGEIKQKIKSLDRTAKSLGKSINGAFDVKKAAAFSRKLSSTTPARAMRNTASAARGAGRSIINAKDANADWIELARRLPRIINDYKRKVRSSEEDWGRQIEKIKVMQGLFDAIPASMNSVSGLFQTGLKQAFADGVDEVIKLRKEFSDSKDLINLASSGTASLSANMKTATMSAREFREALNSVKFAPGLDSGTDPAKGLDYKALYTERNKYRSKALKQFYATEEFKKGPVFAFSTMKEVVSLHAPLKMTRLLETQKDVREALIETQRKEKQEASKKEKGLDKTKENALKALASVQEKINKLVVKGKVGNEQMALSYQEITKQLLQSVEAARELKKAGRRGDSKTLGREIAALEEQLEAIVKTTAEKNRAVLVSKKLAEQKRKEESLLKRDLSSAKKNQDEKRAESAKKRQSALRIVEALQRSINSKIQTGTITAKQMAAPYQDMIGKLEKAKALASSLFESGDQKGAIKVFGDIQLLEKQIQQLANLSRANTKLAADKKKIASYQAALRSLGNALFSFGPRSSSASRGILRLGTRFGALRTVVAGANPYLLAFGVALAGVYVQAKLVAYVLSKLRKAISRLAAVLKAVARIVMWATSLFIGLTSSLVSLGKSIVKLSFKALSSSVKSVLFPIFNLIEGFKQLARYAPLLSAIGTIQFGRDLAKTFTEFDDQITRVNTNLQNFDRSAGSAFDTVRQKVLDISDTTVFTATETARATDILVRAGLSANQALSALSPTLNLAVTGNTGIEKAADIVISAVNTFGIGVGQLENLTDAIRSSSIQAQVEVTDLASTIQNAGFVFKEAGISIEEMLAVTTQLGKQGVTGERAGTALRRGATEIVSAMKDQLGQINRLIKKGSGDANAELSTFLDASGAKFRPGGFLDLLEVFEQAKISLKDLQELLGARGQFFAGIFGAGGTASIRRTLENIKLDQEFNIAAKQAGSLTKSLGNMLKILKSIGENIKVNLIAPLEGQLKNTLERVQEAMQEVSALVQGSGFRELAQTLASSFSATAISALKIASILGKWIALANGVTLAIANGLAGKALSSLSRILEVVNKRISSLLGFSQELNSWGDVIAKITASFEGVKRSIDGISKSWEKMWTSITAESDEFKENFTKNIQAMATFLGQSLIVQIRLAAQVAALEFKNAFLSIPKSFKQKAIDFIPAWMSPGAAGAKAWLQGKLDASWAASPHPLHQKPDMTEYDNLLKKATAEQVRLLEALEMGNPAAAKIVEHMDAFAAKAKDAVMDVVGAIQNARQSPLDAARQEMNKAKEDLLQFSRNVSKMFSGNKGLNIFDASLQGVRDAMKALYAEEGMVMNRLKRAWNGFLDSVQNKERLAEADDTSGSTGRGQTAQLVGVADFFNQMQQNGLQVRQTRAAEDTARATNGIWNALQGGDFAGALQAWKDNVENNTNRGL